MLFRYVGATMVVGGIAFFTSPLTTLFGFSLLIGGPVIGYQIWLHRKNVNNPPTLNS